VIISICTTDAPDVRNFAPDVPARVANVVRKALCRNLADRFKNADEFIDALRGAAPDLVSSNPSSPRDIALDRTLPSASSPRGNAVDSSNTPANGEASEPVLPPPRHHHRPLSTLLLIGLSVMFLGFAATVILMGSRRLASTSAPPPTGLVSTSALKATDKELRILTLPPDALVRIDGQTSIDHVVRGSLGSTHQVRVEADGRVSTELTVVLDGTTTELRVELRTVAPDMATAVDAGRVKAKPTLTQPPGSFNGIAGGLKLKTELP
jgi:hypothetical protein